MPGQFVAATVAIWNPYVAERLLQGHWSLLVGYGCLPWVAYAMRPVAHRRRRSVRAGILDGAGRTDSDRSDAGRDGGTGLRRGTGRGPVALAVRSDSAGGGGAGRPAVVDGLGADGLVVGLPVLRRAGLRGVRRPGRTGARHAGQPGRAGWHLECRGRTRFAVNTFRGGGDRGPARCGGDRASGGGPAPRCAAAAGAGRGRRRRARR